MAAGGYNTGLRPVAGPACARARREPRRHAAPQTARPGALHAQAGSAGFRVFRSSLIRNPSLCVAHIFRQRDGAVVASADLLEIGVVLHPPRPYNSASPFATPLHYQFRSNSRKNSELSFQGGGSNGSRSNIVGVTLS